MATTGLFAGMDDVTLQTYLSNAQTAYIQLSTGAKAVKLRYQQGGGEQEVEYTATNLPALANLISQLQQALGVTATPRQALRVRF